MNSNDAKEEICFTSCVNFLSGDHLTSKIWIKLFRNIFTIFFLVQFLPLAFFFRNIFTYKQVQFLNCFNSVCSKYRVTIYMSAVAICWWQAASAFTLAYSFVNWNKLTYISSFWGDKKFQWIIFIFPYFNSLFLMFCRKVFSSNIFHHLSFP